MEIVFTLLAKDVRDFEAQLLRMAPLCKIFQIDVQDGVYVPNKTLSVEDIRDSLIRLTHSHGTLLGGCVFDFHLQVADYLPSLEALRTIKSTVKIRYVLVHLNFSRPSLVDMGQLPICPTLNPEDHCTTETQFMGRPLMSFSAIQIMTIHPGPQGQAFMPKELEKIAYLRQSGYTGKLIIDGGVNATTIEYVSSLSLVYQPDIVCVGSYLSKAPDQEVGGRIEMLNDLVR